MAGRNGGIDPKRIERARCKLGISRTEITWLLAVDPTAYDRWMRSGVCRFALVGLVVQMLERAIVKGMSIPYLRQLMGITVGADGIPQQRSPKERTDEQRARAWAFIASRAYTQTELQQQPLIME